MKPVFEPFNLPADLRNCGKQYVVWKSVNRGKGKPAKMPFNQGGNPASVSNPADWMTFKEAVALYGKGGYSGVGLVMTPGLELVGVDVDNCIDQGDVVRHAKLIGVLKHGNFYVEYSPSATGIRAFTYARTATDITVDGVEIYGGHGGRYLTLTGNGIYHDLGSGQAQINEILALVGEKAGPQLIPAHVNLHSNRGNENTDDEIPLPAGIVKEALDHIYASECPYQYTGPIGYTMGWVQVGMALYDNASLIGEQALDDFFGLWDEWSAKDPDRYQPAKLNHRWVGFGKRAPTARRVTIGSVIKCAQNNGFCRDLAAYYRQVRAKR